MPNPVAKYKYWAAADYDGYTDLWPSLKTEIDSWITAISTNAGISGYLPSRVKDLDDGNSTFGQVGLVYEFPNPDGGSIHYQTYAQSNSTRNTRLTVNWADNGYNYGYGSGDTLAGEQHPWTDTGANYGLFIASDTTNEQEFFIAGVYSGANTNQQDTIFACMRSVTKHWGIFTNDGTTNHLAWWSPQANDYKEDVAIWPNQNGAYMPLMSGPGGQTGIGTGKVFCTANPRILNPDNWETGAYFGQSPYSVYSTANGGLNVLVGG